LPGETSSPAAFQPILKAFPLPNGKDLGNGMAEFASSYSNPSNLDASSVRMDYHLTERITLFGRYSDTPSSTTSRYATNLSNLHISSVPIKTFTLGLTATLANSLVNDFRFGFSDNAAALGYRQDSFGGAIPLPGGSLIPSQYDQPGAYSDFYLQFPGATANVS